MTTVGDALAAEAAQRPAEPARFATGLLGPAAVLVALLSAFATFIVLAGLTPINPTHDVVVALLGVNALAVLLLLGIIGREVWHILQARRRGRAAARLHVQIVALFSIIAALPSILVAVVASVTLDRGLDRLFSIRARSMIENSLIVADAYIREHAQSIRADTDAMAIDVARVKPMFDQDRDRFRQFFTAQASLRDLPTAMMIAADATVILKADIQLPPEVAAAGGAAAGDAGQGGGGPAAGRVPERLEFRRRGDQAARLRQRLSLRRPFHRSPGAGTDPRNPDQHHRIHQSRSRAASASRSRSR